MTDQGNIHELAQRLRDAAAPVLGDALEQVDEFLFVGEEGLAIEITLDVAGRSLPDDLTADLIAWANTLPADRAATYLERLGRRTTSV